MFITIGLVDQGFVSVLAIFFVFVSSETESFIFIVSTFLDVALVLGDWTRKFVIIIGASFGNILDSAVTAVACSLLDLSLFFDGRNNCFPDMARWEVSIDSAGFLVNQIVVCTTQTFFHARVGNSSVAQNFVVNGIGVQILAGLVHITFEVWVEWVLFI